MAAGIVFHNLWTGDNVAVIINLIILMFHICVDFGIWQSQRRTFGSNVESPLSGSRDGGMVTALGLSRAFLLDYIALIDGGHEL